MLHSKPLPITLAPCQHIFYAAHRDAGFFIHSINQFYGGVHSPSSPTRLYCHSIDSISDDIIALLSCFCIILPLQDASRANDKAFNFLTRSSLINAINEQRCKLVIDFSNETCGIQLFEQLNSLLISYGIMDTSHCAILSQNRQLGHFQSSHNILKPFSFDFFPLATLHKIHESVSQESLRELVDSRFAIEKAGNILCLNATPRLHRIITLLMLIKVGLIDKSSTQTNSDVRCPFISFPGFNYSKTDGLGLATTKQALIGLGLEDRLPDLEWLISVSPLRVDNLTEEGNQLATKIILEHYLNTHLSVVNETGTDNSTKRLTEKTLKPLALGHPFVVVGHLKTVELARELGFSTMDHIIDHGYDSEPDPLRRTANAVSSAKKFVDMIYAGEVRPSMIMPHSTHNINWARNGFMDFYYERFVIPILRFMRIGLS
jgi:hypothetical protein